MHVIKVVSEWDLGIPELYEDKALAEMYVRSAIISMEDDLEMTYEECIDENCITYEAVEVVTWPE